MHNAEYIGLWLRARAARALSLSAS
jgi:hypothetical protein